MELKACPFCGGEAEEELQRGSFEGYQIMNVYCQKCSASAGNPSAWNTRTDLKPLYDLADEWETYGDDIVADEDKRIIFRYHTDQLRKALKQMEGKGG